MYECKCTVDQPGLLGPHFPQVLCVTGMARAEMLSYFGHAEGNHPYIHTYKHAYTYCFIKFAKLVFI